MVLLAERRGDGIDRGRVGEDFVLGDECGGRVLRHHETGVEAGVLHEQAGHLQVTDGVAMQQHIDAALGDGGNLGSRNGEVVEDKGQRFAMEIAAAEHVAVLEHQRIVRRGVDLGLDDGTGVFDGEAHGAVHLRHAAKRVGVLHLGAMGVGRQDFRAPEQLAEIPGDILLALVRAGGVDARVVRGGAAAGGLQGHRRRDVGGPGDVGDAEEAVDRVGGHELRAVNEAEALLRLQPERFEAEFPQHDRGTEPAALIDHFTQPKQGQDHVGQRREVARGAQRALGIDNRQGVLVVETDEVVHDALRDAGKADGEAVDLEQ